MFIKDIDPERLKLLTPEQLKVVERWDREAQERHELIPELCSSYNGRRSERVHELAEKLLATDAEYCEHGRHKYSSCMGCEEIEKILYPEAHEDDE